MDEVQIILYILAAVAYFIFMQWRKAFQAPDEKERPKPRQERRMQPEQERRPRPVQPSQPATSFEDILRELKPKMEQAKQEAETVYERAREKVQPVPPMAPPVAENPRPYRSYEDLAPKVFSWEKPDEARMAAKRAEQRQEKVFKAYTQESAPVSRYAKLLRNPQSAREAIILSEIFNRKHF